MFLTVGIFAFFGGEGGGKGSAWGEHPMEQAHHVARIPLLAVLWRGIHRCDPVGCDFLDFGISNERGATIPGEAVTRLFLDSEDAGAV